MVITCIYKTHFIFGGLVKAYWPSKTYIFHDISLKVCHAFTFYFGIDFSHIKLVPYGQ